MALAIDRASSAEKAASKRAVARPAVPQGTPPTSAVEPDDEAVLEHELPVEQQATAETDLPATAPVTQAEVAQVPAPKPVATEPDSAAPHATPVTATIIEPEPPRDEHAPHGPESAKRTDAIVVRRRGRVGTGLALVGLGIKTLLFGTKKKR